MQLKQYQLLNIMSKSSSYFVVGKFGAAQGVRGAVRVISLMDNPADIFDASNWYVSTKALVQAIPAARSYSQVCGIDADQHLQGGRISQSSFNKNENYNKTLDLSSISPMHWQNHSKGFVVTFADLENRDQARLLTHQLVYLPLEYLDAQGADDELFWRQLIGLQVQDTLGQDQGVVSEMLETGANDVMVVTGVNGSRTLVPYIPDRVIDSVDLESQMIVLNWDFEGGYDD